jgi:hypothetical protein
MEQGRLASLLLLEWRRVHLLWLALVLLRIKRQAALAKRLIYRVSIVCAPETFT